MTTDTFAPRDQVDLTVECSKRHKFVSDKGGSDRRVRMIHEDSARTHMDRIRGLVADIDADVAMGMPSTVESIRNAPICPPEVLPDWAIRNKNVAGEIIYGPPVKFRITLAKAVRIVGSLDDKGRPTDARLDYEVTGDDCEVLGWSWMPVPPEEAADLLVYARIVLGG